MNILHLFETYAAQFELTFADDDWQRLEQHFHADVVYITSGFQGSRVAGRPLVLETLRNNVLNFDRKCDSRQLRTTEGPVVAGEKLTRTWQCRFTLNGAEDLLIEGRETVIFKDSRIIQLEEEILPHSVARMKSWMAANGNRL